MTSLSFRGAILLKRRRSSEEVLGVCLLGKEVIESKSL